MSRKQILTKKGDPYHTGHVDRIGWRLEPVGWYSLGGS